MSIFLLQKKKASRFDGPPMADQRGRSYSYVNNTTCAQALSILQNYVVEVRRGA